MEDAFSKAAIDSSVSHTEVSELLPRPIQASASGGAMTRDFRKSRQRLLQSVACWQGSVVRVPHASSEIVRNWRARDQRPLIASSFLWHDQRMTPKPGFGKRN